MSPNAIRQYLLDEGYRAKFEEENEGVTCIASGVDGIQFTMLFFRAEPYDGDLDSYHSIMFTTGITLEDDADLAKVNAANSESIFLKAYADEGSIWIEMGVPVPETGLPAGMFEEFFECWTSNLPGFVEELI